MRGTDSINRKLEKRWNGRIRAVRSEENRSITVSGTADSYAEALEACLLCVSKQPGWHVVNHITVPGLPAQEMHLPKESDASLEGAAPDVLVIGGGICGAAIARELMRRKLDVLLVEKEADLAVQASSRNDGEVHPGVDQKKKNIKLSYELRGNAMYPDLCAELGVPFRRNGQFVAFRGKWLTPLLQLVALQRRSIGIRDTRVLGKKQLYAMQPNLNPGYDCAIYSPSAGTVCPYGLTIACAENAAENGAEIRLNTAVLDMQVENGTIVSVRTTRGTVYPKLVINAAGVWSDRIAAMAGDEFFSIHPRRGTEALLDRKCGGLTDAIVSYRDVIVCGEKNTKGGGILHTVDDNILVGPDAVETPDREDYATHPESIRRLFDKQKKTIRALDTRDIITWFTGVRAADFEEDFIVEWGRSTDNILHCAAIQSPGLTAAPAIAQDISAMAAEYLHAEPNPAFNPVRKPIPALRNLPDAERAALIQSNPDYGVIVCRCEEISRGEILDALRSPICVPTVDGVKRRVRPGMGRCQGSFCGPLVTQIIAEFLGTEPDAVTKNGNESAICYGRLKG